MFFADTDIIQFAQRKTIKNILLALFAIVIDTNTAKWANTVVNSGKEFYSLFVLAFPFRRHLHYMLI